VAVVVFMRTAIYAQISHLQSRNFPAHP